LLFILLSFGEVPKCVISKVVKFPCPADMLLVAFVARRYFQFERIEISNQKQFLFIPLFKRFIGAYLTNVKGAQIKH